jgi:hypothetical protein
MFKARQPRRGDRKKYFVRPILSLLPELETFDALTHGSRRGLLPCAPPALNASPLKIVCANFILFQSPAALAAGKFFSTETF